MNPGCFTPWTLVVKSVGFVLNSSCSQPSQILRCGLQPAPPPHANNQEVIGVHWGLPGSCGVLQRVSYDPDARIYDD